MKKNMSCISLCVFFIDSLFHGGDRKATAAYKMPEESPDSLFIFEDTPDTTENTKGETIPVEDNSDLLRYQINFL